MDVNLLNKGTIRSPPVAKVFERRNPLSQQIASRAARFGGQAGIAEFTNLRWITIETQPQHYPF